MKIPSRTVYLKSIKLCLHFANTLDWHASHQPQESLNTYSDLVNWSVSAGLLNANEAGQLILLAEESAEQADNLLRQAVTLREAIYRIFSGLAKQKPPDIDDLEIINHTLATGMARARLFVAPKGYQWGWVRLAEPLEGILWPIARSAALLITDPSMLARIGQCQDEHGCGHLFLDLTRNHSRRWCSMKSCGNRAKAQRHYQRKQEAAN